MSRILVIDDDQMLRRALLVTLKKMGHEVREACDGRAGLQAYGIESFDLVITDLIMPDMEGVETIRALKKLRTDLPIIAISGGGRGSPDNYLLIAKKFGANVVLAKPFDFAALSAAVTMLIGKNGRTAGETRDEETS